MFTARRLYKSFGVKGLKRLSAGVDEKLLFIQAR
jgi:hypothetical protein